jgi:DNA-binding protein HU-beta
MAKALPKTKAQIIAALADKAGIKKTEAKVVLDELVVLAYAGAKQPKGFVIPGLGKMVLVSRKARIGRNPMTGAEIKIPAKKVLKFRVAKAAKDAVK